MFTRRVRSYPVLNLCYPCSSVESVVTTAISRLIDVDGFTSPASGVCARRSAAGRRARCSATTPAGGVTGPAFQIRPSVAFPFRPAAGAFVPVVSETRSPQSSGLRLQVRFQIPAPCSALRRSVPLLLRRSFGFTSPRPSPAGSPCVSRPPPPGCGRGAFRRCASGGSAPSAG